MKKPVIGITPLFDDRMDSYWMVPGYMKGIMKAGGVPVILPLTDDPDSVDSLMERLDGVLISGGPDIDPRLYNEEVIMESGILTPFRDHFEVRVIQTAIDRDLPCFGICRGMQLMNVLKGGTLYQDLESQHPVDADHHQSGDTHVTYHDVAVKGGSILHEIVGTEVLGVNTLHHQAVKDLAQGLEALAVSSDGDLIEAFWDPAKKFYLGVQWHPEFLFHKYPAHMALFQAFVDACK